MACGTTICFLKPLLALGAIAAIGMGGYNLATTGCPLGSCDTSDQNTTLTSRGAAGPVASPCGSCTGEAEGASAALVAHEGQAQQAGGCSDAMKAACQAMGECPEGMMEHCQQAGECPMGGSVEASLVADGWHGTDTGAQACDQDCDAACEQTCEQRAEQSADADADNDTEASEG